MLIKTKVLFFLIGALSCVALVPYLILYLNSGELKAEAVNNIEERLQSIEVQLEKIRHNLPLVQSEPIDLSTQQLIINEQRLKLLIEDTILGLVEVGEINFGGQQINEVITKENQIKQLAEDRQQEIYDEVQDWVNQEIEANTFTMTKLVFNPLMNSLSPNKINKLISSVVMRIQSGEIDGRIVTQ